MEKGSDLMSKPSTAMDEARGRPLCFVATWDTERERAIGVREPEVLLIGWREMIYLEADASRALALEAQQLLQPQAPQVAELRLRPAVWGGRWGRGFIRGGGNTQGCRKRRSPTAPHRTYRSMSAAFLSVRCSGVNTRFPMQPSPVNFLG